LDTISRTYKVLDGKDTVHTTTLIAYSSAGCTDTVTKQITVYRAPIVDFIAYPETRFIQMLLLISTTEVGRLMMNITGITVMEQIKLIMSMFLLMTMHMITGEPTLLP
jgi:hypothetical protein